jgi:CRP-like cAMP-binding protein
MVDDDAIRALAATTLALDLSAEEVGALAELGRLVETGPGHVLLEQGAPGDGLVVLLSGTAEVLGRQDGGAEHRLAVVEAGAVLGEIGLLEPVPRTATVRCLEPGRAWLLERAAFDALVDMGHPAALGVALAVGRVLARRLAAMDRRVVALLEAGGGAASGDDLRESRGDEAET